MLGTHPPPNLPGGGIALLSPSPVGEGWGGGTPLALLPTLA